MEIIITDRAKNQLNHLKEESKTNKPWRIYIKSYGWCPTFGLTQDEVEDGDIRIEKDDFTFIASDIIEERFHSFTIDYGDNPLRRNFKVTETKN